MRRLFLSIVLFCFCVGALSQATASDDALLAKARALYDAPFTRGLVSFDCAVQFDWKKHIIDLLGTVPPTAVPTAERLQTIQHRVFVDRSGAVVSAIPKTPDLAGIEHAAELEQTLNAMVVGGLNAWLPFSTNVILPMTPTKFSFQKNDTGYNLTMNGPGVAATLLLKDDLRVTSGVAELPQPLRFNTEFISGTNGYLLESLETASMTDAGSGGEASFAYTYQAVQGFLLPSQLTVTQLSTSEAWRYALSDCRVVKGFVVNVGPPVQ